MPFVASIGGQFGYGRSQADASQQTGIVTNGLLLYLDAGNSASYPGSGTTWTDLSSNANNATSLTGVTYSSENGGILTFNGTSGSGTLVGSKYNTIYTGKTVFIAANLTALTTSTYRALLGTSGLVSQRNFNFYFYSPSSGNYQVTIQGGAATSTSISGFTLGNWFTIAYTQVTDGTVKYYYNGLHFDTKSDTFNQYVAAPDEYVGRADNFWNGPIGVICVYGTELSAAQILQNHNAVWSRYSVLSSSASILAAARTLSTTSSGQTIAPTAVGPLTINSEAVGNYEYTVKGTTTLSSFTASDWFTSTEDTVSSWIIVNGDLTINAGQTIIPPVRKLFTVVYVTGNLVVNGSISMTGRGANHSGTGSSGGATTAVAIRIGTGTFSAVTNPQIPATGGAGGAAFSGTNGANTGTSGSNGASGGGGSGYRFLNGTSGAGSAGTCFSGGTGGGGIINVASTAGNGGVSGGAGGQGLPVNSPAVTGGTGNPGGNSGTAQAGGNGTGGTLIVIVAGSLSGTGSIVANGVNSNRIGGGPPGGASGGGSVTVLFGTNPSGPTTLTATGGNGLSAGNGGNGTARKLAIGAN